MCNKVSCVLISLFCTKRIFRFSVALQDWFCFLGAIVISKSKWSVIAFSINDRYSVPCDSLLVWLSVRAARCDAVSHALGVWLLISHNIPWGKLDYRSPSTFEHFEIYEYEIYFRHQKLFRS